MTLRNQILHLNINQVKMVGNYQWRINFNMTIKSIMIPTR